MKKSILFVLFALISVAGFSQITGWNAKVGMNFSNYTGDLDMNAKVGFKLGGGFEYAFDDTWSLQPSLFLTGKGAKKDALTVNAYYLEFDDERSGGFASLKEVTDDKKVVLGLITTKSPKLEDKETVIARIHEASRYIPLDRLSLSPQCGFASCEIGNKLTEEEQWAKLALVKEIAQEVWG